MRGGGGSCGQLEGPSSGAGAGGGGMGGEEEEGKRWLTKDMVGFFFSSVSLAVGVWLCLEGQMRAVCAAE